MLITNQNKRLDTLTNIFNKYIDKKYLMNQLKKKLMEKN